MKSKGFSLIELLIVMVIAGIIMAIAYPGYQSYIVKSRRSDGQSALMDLASRMERYYSENNTYANASIGTGKDTDVLSSNQSPEGWYTLSISNASESGYDLHATPNNAQAANDTECQTLTLDSKGIKGTEGGTAKDPSTCW